MSSRYSKNVDPALNKRFKNDHSENMHRTPSDLKPGKRTHNPCERTPLTVKDDNQDLPTSEDPLKPHHLSELPTNDFYLYKSPVQQFKGPNMFDKLSDEMVLRVFKYLPKKALVRVSLTCRRLHRIVLTDVLWTRLDLARSKLKPGSVGNILSRGVVILRLAQSNIHEPIFENPYHFLSFQSKLQFLDLSMSSISLDSLQLLLSKCRRLRKLSLEHVPVNDDVCLEISKNLQLESLNLTMSSGITSDGLTEMMEQLSELKNLNISWTGLTMEAISVLVKKLNPNALKLNVAGCKRTFVDTHLKILVTRCSNLQELDISDCGELTSAGAEVLSELQRIEYISLSRCYNIEVPQFLATVKIPSLRYLDAFGLMSNELTETLAKSFPKVGLNKFIFSSVARPTVGTRRTSIWGLRTRD